MYYDLQVNGYGGVDFNRDDLTLADLSKACALLQRDQVEGILATIITDNVDVMAGRLARLVALREQDSLVRDVIHGLHIEGPFLNEMDGYRGAHPLDAVMPANLDVMKRLLDAAGGLTRIVTLAPERDANMTVTRFLADQNISVSAGHCDPTGDELDAAIDAGLLMFTHLGNGCPMLMHRHNNIIQRVLARADRLHLMFIADGTHVPFDTLANYLKVVDRARTIVVSDATTPAGLGPGRYTISRWEVDVGEDLVIWAPDRSHFIGSAMSMPRCDENLRKHLRLAPAEVKLLTCDNPKRLLRETP